MPSGRSKVKTVFDALKRHPIHPFPARMAPSIALDALANQKKLRVLDPMMGSGTVLAVAKAEGHYATGIDLDPLAVLLTRVWTSELDKKTTFKKAEEVLTRAKRLFCELPQSDAYPKNSDSETKAFIRYWFDVYSRRQLTALSIAISRVRKPSTRDALWCAFSRLIITKSTGASLAMDLAHSRPHREYTRAPIKPFERFLSAVKVVADNCLPHKGRIGPNVKVRQGDARRLQIKRASIDLVLTSPPYLNAIDYMRCSKFSLVWMGYKSGEIRKLRAGSIGAESASEEASSSREVRDTIRSLRLAPKLSSRNQEILRHYVWDMRQTLHETNRVLKVGGKAIYVVGDSTVRGTYIRNSTIVSTVARQHGLLLLERHSRDLPESRRYLPPPRRQSGNANMDARMRREVVLVFRKTSAKPRVLNS